MIYVLEIFHWKPKSQLSQIYTDALSILKLTLRNISLPTCRLIFLRIVGDSFEYQSR